MGLTAADLVDDRGAAAETDDFFRSRAFLDAEGVTHTLRLESAERTALVPLIAREVEGEGSTRSRPTATRAPRSTVPASLRHRATSTGRPPGS